MTGSTLKIIAVITMIIDHVGMMFFPQYIAFRIVGRLAFILFCFLLVEGFFYTRNEKKYFIRLFIFALISEIPFDIAISGTFPFWDSCNVFFTLAIGFGVIVIIDRVIKNNNYFFVLLTALIGMGISEAICSDYGFRGIGIILCFYYLRKSEARMQQIAVLVALAAFNMGSIQIFGLLALIPIYFYNDKRGLNLKYLFYIVYPLHLALFAWLKYAKGLGTF